MGNDMMKENKLKKNKNKKKKKKQTLQNCYRHEAGIFTKLWVYEYVLAPPNLDKEKTGQQLQLQPTKVTKRKK
ncbi:hypothetical protein BLOT_003494 [Blomia tropicalis]|nr:hypothetical protein BLOT_003494 [Blomia tropicalis]